MPEIVILTGAGISADSGVETFRDEGGVWSKNRLEDVATPEGFARDPALVNDFYNQRRRQMADVAPNAAHIALARLEERLGDELLLVTQNIDDLHERGGSKQVLHMHGELFKAKCAHCDHHLRSNSDLSPATRCENCGEIGGMRPAVVWFGEIPLGLNSIGQALRDCALFVSIGTSGNVYPAAGFVAEAKAAGATTVELNMEATSGLFDESRLGRAKDVVPAWVDEVVALL